MYISVTAMVQFCLKFSGNVQFLTPTRPRSRSVHWQLEVVDKSRYLFIYCALPGPSHSPVPLSPLPGLCLRNKAKVGVGSTQHAAVLTQLCSALCCAGPFWGTFQFWPKKVHLLNSEAFKQPWHCLIRVLNVFRHSMFSVTGKDSTKCRAQ